MRAALISLGSVSSEWVEKAMKKYFQVVDNIDIREIEADLGAKGMVVLHNGQSLKKYDCVLAKGSFRYVSLLRAISTALEGKCYMPIKADAFTIGHDKILTQLILQQNNIPMPTTYLSSSANAAKKLLAKLNFPIIMKFPQGTGGKGVMFSDSFAAASSMLDALTALKQPFLIQEYVETEGADIRAIVVGDKVVASMKRKAEKGETRANIHAGGKGEQCVLDTHTKKIAVNTAKAIGAEICAVDILESNRGPLVIEVNLSPGLQGITGATNIDVADKIAKHLYSRTKELTEKGKKEHASKIFEDLGILKEGKGESEILSSLDFRGERILLPEFVTKVSKFNEKDNFVIKAQEGKIQIQKMDIKE